MRLPDMIGTPLLRHAVRALAKTPGFTAVAILTLVVGIGANTAIFSVVHAVLLRPLPYRDAERIVVVWEDLIREGNHRFSVASPNFEDLRRRSRSFSMLAAQLGTGYTLTGDGAPPEALSAGQVTGDFFALLGVRASVGRVILPQDVSAGAPARIAVLGNELWIRRFGADRRVLGRTIRLNDQPYEVVGIMPPGFDAPSQLKAPHHPADIWTPIDLPKRWDDRGIAVLQVFGRLAAGTSLEAANAELRVLAGTLAREYPPTNSNVGLHAVPLRNQLFGEVRSSLVILSVAVGLVLLVACVNLAHLLLLRFAARYKEVAIRVALGASRGQIVAALVTEGFLLAAVGGTIAWLLVSEGLSLLVGAAPQEIPRLAQVRPDASVLAFAIAATFAVGVLTSLLPALRAASADPESALRGEAVASSRSAGRLRAALVVSQIAFALVLTSGATLLVRTFEHLRHLDVGFDPAGVVTARLVLPKSRYDTSERQTAFFHELFRQLEARPDIAAAGGTTRFPLDPAYGVGTITFDGRPRGSTKPVVGVRVIGGRYFEALRIPLRSGRLFEANAGEPNDRSGGAPVALVNETMARRFWPGASPLGKRIAIGSPPDDWITIVGVVADVSHDGIEAAPVPEAYLPLSQDSESALNLVVRSRSDGRSLPGTLTAVVRRLDPGLPLIELRPMAQRVSDALAQPRFLLESFSGFSALALVLSTMALFTLVAHDAGKRRREIGIRMTLGALDADIVRLLLVRALRLLLVGCVLGVAGGFVLARLVSSLSSTLHGTKPYDPLAFGGATLLLCIVAFGAALVPAWRATRGDPLSAIRAE